MTRILAFLALASVVLHDGTAWAHVRLTQTVPAADSVVATAPAAVSLTFSGVVMPIACKVVGADGKEVGGAAKAEGKTVQVPLNGTLGAGRYTVDCRVAGDDGHAMNSTMSFTVQAAKP